MQLSRDISGQNFIVTGAARGIGLAISTLFCNLGAKVSGWDIHAGEMRNNSVFADTQDVDVTNEQATLAGFASSLHRLGDIDGIILVFPNLTPIIYAKESKIQVRINIINTSSFCKSCISNKGINI